jgi:uncharacterized membrane protein YhaH (DUF805 family)
MEDIFASPRQILICVVRKVKEEDVMPGIFELIITLIVAAVVIVPLWRIFARAGFSGALSLLMLIPGVNLIMIYFLAFARWPALASENRG